MSQLKNINLVLKKKSLDVMSKDFNLDKVNYF